MNSTLRAASLSLVSATALAASLSSVGFADEVSPADATRIAELKTQLRAIARDNLGRRDNLVETRAQLDPLVNELARFHPSEDAKADLPALVGAWKEIYSDDVEPEPPGFKTDRDATYQVISDKGYFYNFSNLTAGPLSLLGVLRGEYTPAKDFLNIEFTKVSIRPFGLGEKDTLTDLVENLEAGKVFTVVPPGSNRAPNGPVGARGNIKALYVDQDFRVATGSNFADGKYDIYLLDRVTAPVRYK